MRRQNDIKNFIFSGTLLVQITGTLFIDIDNISTQTKNDIVESTHCEF